MTPIICAGQTYRPERIFCIGRNYVDHVQELNNAIPTRPVIFMKPASSLVPANQTLTFPTHGQELHQEAEVVVLVGKSGRPQTPAEALAYIAGLSLGLDLTLRDVQNELKNKGLPWELAKAFDGSAPIGEQFVPYTSEIDLEKLTFTCHFNGELRQQGDTSYMMFPIAQQLVAIAQAWELRPGDLIYTGTPAGVGVIRPGDMIVLASPQLGSFQWVMAN